MEKRNTILIPIFLIMSTSNLFGQTIEIGDDANKVKGLIEWITNDHSRRDSYGNTTNSIWTWDVQYYDGQIADVIQCYKNQYLLDFRIVANYCKHYVMGKNGTLSYILTEYENISLEKLKSFYLQLYPDHNFNELYFSDDLKHYSKIYLSKNGYPTVEWRKTILNELPKDVQQMINKQQQLSTLENIFSTSTDTLLNNIMSTLHASNFYIGFNKEQNDSNEYKIYTLKNEDSLQIRFELDKNQNTKTGPNEIYISITGPDEQLVELENSTSGKFTTRENGEMFFTKKIDIYYKQGEKQIVTFPWGVYSKLEMGQYKIEVYNNGYKVGEKLISLPL